MEQKREMFAWIAKDPSGHEGIIMFMARSGPMPLVCQERSNAYAARDVAKAAAKARGHTARLVRFEEVEVLLEIEP